MWWSKKQEAENAPVAVQIAIPEPEPAPKPKVIEIPPFGAQAHGLTRFGNTWLNLSEMTALEFDPPDGCGAECTFKNCDDEWHIPEQDAAALRAYLEGFENIRTAVDEAARQTSSDLSLPG